MGSIRSQGKGQGAAMRAIDPPTGLSIALDVFAE